MVFLRDMKCSKGGVKMKGNKKILVVALLLFLVAARYGTYAIYRSSVSGTGNVSTAAWQISFKKGANAVQNLNFTGSDVTWTVNPSAVAGKIAPGAEGYIDFTIDATGSEVDVYYLATLGDGATDGIDVSMSVGGNTVTTEQLLAYAASNMSTTVRVNVSWDGDVNDDGTKDTADLALATAGNISIPITLTARQSLTNKTGTGA